MRRMFGSKRELLPQLEMEENYIKSSIKFVPLAKCYLDDQISEIKWWGM
jgi:hypothetical protein